MESDQSDNEPVRHPANQPARGTEAKRQAGRHTDRHRYRHTDRETYEETDTQTNTSKIIVEWTDNIQTGKHMCTCRQVYRHTER